MPLPGLFQFLSYPPSYPLATTLQTVIMALGQSMDASPSHIIVVDAQQRPLGGLPMGRLWVQTSLARVNSTVALSHSEPLGSLSSLPPKTSLQAQLLDYQAWLEPIVPISVNATVADLWAQIQAAPVAVWVAVDADGRYQGVVNAAALVTWLADPQATARGDYPSARVSIPTPSAQERNWVLAVGHALKTPLTSLLGLSTLLLDPRVGALTERQTRYAGLMRQAIRQLIRLVNQLVDWMRLESNQMGLDLTPVALQPLVDSLLSGFLSGWLPESDPPPDWVQRFTITVNPALTAVLADRLRLQQSLHGVLDYLLQQGAEPTGLTLDRWGSWVSFTLGATSPSSAPTGPQPWAEPSSCQRGADTLEPLGLALAAQICQSHGGDLVGFWSAIYGYQMSLLLPLAAESVLGGEDNLPKTLVLLVSRQSALIDQVYGQLQDTHFCLVVAASWSETVGLVRRLEPAAIILDNDGLAIAPALALLDLNPAPADRPLIVLLGTAPDPLTAAQTTVIPTASLGDRLLPTLAQIDLPLPQISLTLLLLHYPTSPRSQSPGRQLSRQWCDELQRYRCRLLQADDLTQASLLCRIWRPQAILLDSHEPLTPSTWRHLTEFPDLAQPPLVTLTPLTAELPAARSVIDASACLTQPLPLGVVALIQTIQATQGED
jgi:signal transduction histidine kinase